MDIIAIIISLGLMIYLAYKGVSVLILSPLLAMLAVVMTGIGEQAMAMYTQIFMKSLGGFIIKFFPLFLLGALFGKLMEDSKFADTIAHYLIQKLGINHAVLSVILVCAILTYGGVSIFVVTFAVYPIASALFYNLDIPKRLIPGAISVGGLTFTMTALPGSPSIHNAIPIPYFATDTFAAPILGIIASIIMFALGTIYMNIQAKKAKQKNEGYGNHTYDQKENQGVEAIKIKSLIIAIAPIIIVISLNYIFSKQIMPSWNMEYLDETKYAGIKPKAVIGTWSIILSLIIGSIYIIIANYTKFKSLNKTLNSGVTGSFLPIFNTASEVGYGSVIAGLAGFAAVKHYLTSGIAENPLISMSLVINTISGITGSSSGGLGISLDMMGASYLQLAQQQGINPELLHRIATIASGGLDSLPHNGAIITMLAICGLTHKESYKDIFITALCIPLVALITIITLGTLFGSF